MGVAVGRIESVIRGIRAFPGEQSGNDGEGKGAGCGKIAVQTAMPQTIHLEEVMRMASPVLRLTHTSWGGLPTRPTLMDPEKKLQIL